MRLTGSITGTPTRVVVSNNALNVDPGAAGTSNINAPLTVATTLNAKTGTTNLGNNIISGQKATSAVAGLNEFFANGDFYEGAIAGRPNTYGVPDTIQLEPRRANQQDGGTNDNPPGIGGNAPAGPTTARTSTRASSWFLITASSMGRVMSPSTCDLTIASR